MILLPKSVTENLTARRASIQPIPQASVGVRIRFVLATTPSRSCPFQIVTACLLVMRLSENREL